MKDLNSIIAANTDIQNAYDRGRRRARAIVDRGLLEDAREALKIAQASLNDVLRNGDGERQRRNIAQVDLPAIERALRAVEATENPTN